MTDNRLAGNLLRPYIKIVGGYSTADIENVVKRYNLVNDAIELFLSGQINWKEYLDVIEFVHLSVDDYIKELDERNNKLELFID